MNRPTGLTAVAVLTFFGASILALGSFAFFFVAGLAMTGGDEGEPVSIALTGMGVAGGFSLLVLAGAATGLAIGVLKLREWARLISIASMATGIACTIFSRFALRRFVVFPAVPSVACHLLVLATAGWTAEYLSRPQIKVNFQQTDTAGYGALPSCSTPPFPIASCAPSPSTVLCRFGITSAQ